MRVYVTVIAAILLMFSNPATSWGAGPVFADTKGHWAEESVATACQMGLMQGMGPTAEGSIRFAPEEMVTRAQAAAVITRTFSLDYGNFRFIKAPQVTDYYQDVDHHAWYADALVMCAINNVFPNGSRFYPDRPITRLEMAKAVKNSFTARGISVPMIMLMPAYQDTSSLLNEDMNAVVFVSNTGIMRGHEQYFRPFDTMTRAELARVMVVCKNIQDMQKPVSEKGSDPELGMGVALTTKKLESKTKHMEVNLEIPVIQGLADHKVQTVLNSQWEDEADLFQKQVAAGLPEYVEGSAQYGYPLRDYQAESYVQRCYQGSRLVSLYIDYYQYTGGAHGNTDRRAYNVDLATGKNLSLGDLFQAGYDYRKVINTAIQEQISAQPGNYFAEEGMGFAGISPEQGYYIQDGHLMVYFGLYEIAPYAAGIPEFAIPLSRLGDGLKIML